MAFALRGIHFLAAWCRRARSRGGEHPRPVLALMAFCRTVSLKDLATVLCLGHQLGLLTRGISGVLSRMHLQTGVCLYRVLQAKLEVRA